MNEMHLTQADPPFNPADLPIDDEDRIYHLQVKPNRPPPIVLESL